MVFPSHPIFLYRCSGYAGLACYQCYSGELCKTEEDSLSCKLYSTAGNPMYLSEYWLRKISGQDPCVSTPAHYRYCRLCNEWGAFNYVVYSDQEHMFINNIF